MRYAAGILYALAIAGGRGELLADVMIGLCVAAGTVAALFAVEQIVDHAISKEYEDDRS